MRRPPILARGRLWRVLLAALLLTGLGIGQGGHCTYQHTTFQQTAYQQTAVASIGSLLPDGHHDGATPALPHTAAEDCRLVISAEPATTTGVTHASPPIRFPAGVVGDAAPRPVPRLLTGRPLTEIGVSRT
jgi:hypothetical protein